MCKICDMTDQKKKSISRCQTPGLTIFFIFCCVPLSIKKHVMQYSTCLIRWWRSSGCDKLGNDFYSLTGLSYFQMCDWRINSNGISTRLGLFYVSRLRNSFYFTVMFQPSRSSCRIYWLHICRGVRPHHHELPGYDIK